MTHLANHLMATLLQAIGDLDSVNDGSRDIWDSVAMSNVLLVLGLMGLCLEALFVWFLVRAERWDQRHLHLWPGAGRWARRETDARRTFLQASENGPFRKKESRR